MNRAALPRPVSSGDLRARARTPAPAEQLDLGQEPPRPAWRRWAAGVLERRDLTAADRAAILWHHATFPDELRPYFRDVPEAPAPADVVAVFRELEQRERAAAEREAELLGRPVRVPDELRSWTRRAERWAARAHPSLEPLETSSTRPQRPPARNWPEIVATKDPTELAPRRARRLTWLKRRAEKVAAIFAGGGGEDWQRRADRVSGCSTQFGLKVDRSSGEVVGAIVNRCRDRFCPACAYRRALEVRDRVRRAVRSILGVWPDARFAMLTLTARNVPVGELRAAVRSIDAAWKRLTESKDWPAFGYVRFLEVTRGRDGTAHPHLHVLLVLHPSYFTDRGQDATYLPWQRWVELWQRALRVDYRPVVDVRAIRPTRELLRRFRGQAVNPSQLYELAVAESMAELAKYPLKLDKRLLEDPAWFLEACRQLKSARAVSAGGVFRPTVKAAREELERENEAAAAAQRRDPNIVLLWFRWNGVDYVREREEAEVLADWEMQERTLFRKRRSPP